MSSDRSPGTGQQWGTVIPFYGARDRRLFAIERRCMDRDGIVIGRLDALLPAGKVLDIGAGDGFTAERLTRSDRRVIPLEPAVGMIDRGRPLPWVQGAAQHLPFTDHSLDGAYATWAYFFPDSGYGEAGLTELHRVVRSGGPLLIVDNAGEDEFSQYLDDPSQMTSDAAWWAAHGFACEVMPTSFRFDHLDEARELLAFYFGERGRTEARQEVEYRVALYHRCAGTDSC